MHEEAKEHDEHSEDTQDSEGTHHSENTYTDGLQFLEGNIQREVAALQLKQDKFELLSEFAQQIKGEGKPFPVLSKLLGNSAQPQVIRKGVSQLNEQEIALFCRAWRCCVQSQIIGSLASEHMLHHNEFCKDSAWG